MTVKVLVKTDISADASGNVDSSFDDVVQGKIMQVGHLGTTSNMTNTGSLGFVTAVGFPLYLTNGNISGTNFINPRGLATDVGGTLLPGSEAAYIPVGAYDGKITIWGTGCGANKSGLMCVLWYED
jgi:hypothetical protein